MVDESFCNVCSSHYRRSECAFCSFGEICFGGKLRHIVTKCICCFPTCGYYITYLEFIRFVNLNEITCFVANKNIVTVYETNCERTVYNNFCTRLKSECFLKIGNLHNFRLNWFGSFATDFFIFSYIE